MNKLSPCLHCGSFLPLGVRACPGCRRSVRPRRLPAPMRALLAVGGGGLLSVTLSACYGGPCAGDGSCYEPRDSGLPGCTDASRDLDGDGYCLDLDCDETNANVHEGFGCPADGGISTDAGVTDDAGTDGGLITEDGGLTDDGGLSTDDGGLASDAGADAGL